MQGRAKGALGHRAGCPQTPGLQHQPRKSAQAGTVAAPLAPQTEDPPSPLTLHKPQQQAQQTMVPRQRQRSPKVCLPGGRQVLHSALPAPAGRAGVAGHPRRVKSWLGRFAPAGAGSGPSTRCCCAACVCCHPAWQTLVHANPQRGGFPASPQMHVDGVPPQVHVGDGGKALQLKKVFPGVLLLTVEKRGKSGAHAWGTSRSSQCLRCHVTLLSGRGARNAGGRHGCSSGAAAAGNRWPAAQRGPRGAAAWRCTAPRASPAGPGLTSAGAPHARNSTHASAARCGGHTHTDTPHLAVRHHHVCQLQLIHAQGGSVPARQAGQGWAGLVTGRSGQGPAGLGRASWDPGGHRKSARQQSRQRVVRRSCEKHAGNRRPPLALTACRPGW